MYCQAIGAAIIVRQPSTPVDTCRARTSGRGPPCRLRCEAAFSQAGAWSLAVGRIRWIPVPVFRRRCSPGPSPSAGTRSFRRACLDWSYRSPRRCRNLDGSPAPPLVACLESKLVRFCAGRDSASTYPSTKRRPRARVCYPSARYRVRALPIRRGVDDTPDRSSHYGDGWIRNCPKAVCRP